MNLPLAIITLAAGLILLWKCADLLVSGAVALAQRLGMSPLIIGLTVVAMGTSAPEVAASVAAVLDGPGGGDTAVGNICGSNIANLALVGGVITLMRPLLIQRTIMLRELPVMLVTGLIMGHSLRDGNVSRMEALLLLAVFFSLVAGAIYAARQKSISSVGDLAIPAAADVDNSLGKAFLLIFAGLVGLTVGARMAILGATYVGKLVGMSNAVIGLTIVAIGTSLPELITCVVAALKGHHDISIGNLVGSNIFNTLLVTGTAGLIRPFSVGERFSGGIDYWVMMAVSLGFTAMAWAWRGRLSRLGGGILLGTYVAYMAYLLIFTLGSA
ncbi:calcium/sodium antiporter [Planctomycetota bacterium]